MGHVPLILQLFPDLPNDSAALEMIAAGVVVVGILLLFMLAPEEKRWRCRRQIPSRRKAR